MDTESLKTGGHWLGAASGAGVPAFTFFSSFPPPLFPSVSLISAALSGAILFIALIWKPKAERQDQTLPRILKQGMRVLILSVLLLIVYILLLQFTTVPVPIPTQPSTRLQIGFGMSDWTLTGAGRDWKSSNSSLTVEQMIRNEAAFTQDRIGILWQTWSIYLAGFLLIAFYFLAFIAWTSGFALLAKQRTINKERGKGKRNYHVIA